MAGQNINPSELFASLESKYNLPSGMLDAVWKQESGRGKNMLSKAGAEGHFQFMPKTARQYGLADPYDLPSSAEAAARMYGDLSKKYGGDVTKMLAAYNWGQGNLDRKGLESAPAETLGYIKNISKRMGTTAPAEGRDLSAELFAEEKPAAEPQASAEGRDLSAELFGESKPAAAPAAAPYGGFLSDVGKAVSEVTENPVQAIAGSAPVRFAVGAAKPVLGAMQMASQSPVSGLGVISRLGEAAGLGNMSDKIANALASTRQESEAGRKMAINQLMQKATLTGPLEQATGADIAGLAGEVLSPVGLGAGRALPAAQSVAGKIAQGVGIGGTLGATAASEKTGAEYLPAQVQNALIGAGIGGGIPVVGAVGKKGLELGGKLASNLLGTATGTGAKPIQEAAKAGLAGGKTEQALVENMRGGAAMEDVINDAKSALQNMRMERGQAYKQGIGSVTKDPAVLDFAPIEKALQDIKSAGTYKGKVIDRSAADVYQKIDDVVKEWKAASPADFHTVEGMDALKKAVGDILESQPFNTPQRTVAGRVYSAVKEQINKQAPDYAKVMKDYEEASRLIQDIEKTLSLNPKASVDTALRKLQSVMRNNVNTNFGKRAELVQALEGAGAQDINAKLAGQALTSWTPRGLGNLANLGSVGAALATGNPLPLILPAASSPRLVGEAALAAGRAGRGIQGASKIINQLANAAGVNPQVVINQLIQQRTNNGLSNPKP